MKTVVMLLGELEYESNFMLGKSDIFPIHFPSTQLLILLFVLLGSIVIMNLLIGLAVDEIDVMREEGKRIRSDLCVDEIVRLEDLLVKKPTLLDFFPFSMFQKFIIRHRSLFRRLIQRWEENNIHCHPFKVCVRPIVPRKKENKDKSLGTSKIASSFPVYFYHEDKKRAYCATGQETGFELSQTLVMCTMEWLQQKEKEGNN